jgi:hypothetical protein
MFKRTCVVKYSDIHGVEHSIKVEAESVFEAVCRGLYRLDSSFRDETDVWGQAVHHCRGPRGANRAHGEPWESETVD